MDEEGTGEVCRGPFVVEPEEGMLMIIKRALVLGAFAASLSMGAMSLVAASSAIDVQANDPQVAGDPTSNTSAVFPTNKQNEPTIAVNPTDSRFLIAGANDEQRQPPCGPGPVRGANAAANDCSFFPDVGTSGIYTSNDGGLTWTDRGLLDDQTAWRAAGLVSDGDPVIVFGPKPSGSGFSYAQGARAYYATLASYKMNNGPYPAGKAPEYLAVSYSDDNGATWSAPVLATTKNNPNDFNDKESLSVDNLPSSPYFGRLYVSWTEFRSATATGNGNEPIDVAYSTNGGRTFSAPKQVSPAGNNGTGNGRQGSALTTGPDGTVYLAWEQGQNQVIAISRDGGGSWTRPSPIAPVADLLDPIPGANFRTSSFPSIAADPRLGTQTVHVAWAQHTSAGGRIVVSSSTNAGVTWSVPVAVSTAAEGYAFFQGLDVAPNGRVDVAYQALQTGNAATFGTGNARVDSYYVRSAGSGWSAPLRISSASSDPAVSAQNNLARQFWGDYSTLVSTDSRAWFIATSSKSGVGCAAVDQFQRVIAGTAAAHGDMADRVARRLGQDPYAAAPPSKPAPQVECGSQFGNTDVSVNVITP